MSRDTVPRLRADCQVSGAKREESRSRRRRRIGPLARLSLGVRNVLSFVNWPRESRRPDGSERAASGVVLLSRSPRRGLVHWLLSEDGSGRDISSNDVFLHLSGAFVRWFEGGRLVAGQKSRPKCNCRPNNTSAAHKVAVIGT